MACNWSSVACASAPSRACATAVAAGLDSPNSAPRPAESDLPTTPAAAVGLPGDPSYASVPAWFGSPLHVRSTTQSAAPPAVAQTSVRVRWLPSPRASLFPAPRDRDRTSLPPRGAQVATPSALQFRGSFVGRLESRIQYVRYRTLGAYLIFYAVMARRMVFETTTIARAKAAV
jgi:hypothetical protein